MYELPTEIELTELPYTYQTFIQKCKQITEFDIFEVHHIEPISIGGVDLDANKIKLSPINHYIAHKLLALERPYNIKLWQAWWIMYTRHPELGSEEDYSILRYMLDYLPSRHSEEAKKHHSEATKRYLASLTPEEWAERGRKISEANRGRSVEVTEQWRQNLSLAAKRRYEEHPEIKEHLSKVMTGKKGTPHTEEFKKAVSEWSKTAKWFTNGQENCRAKECPDGFWPGITRGLRKK